MLPINMLIPINIKIYIHKLINNMYVSAFLRSTFNKNNKIDEIKKCIEVES